MTEQTTPDRADTETLGVDSGTGPAALPAAGHGAGKSGEVTVLARFHPDGLINSISHRPEQLDPQEWFDRLCLAVPTTYQPLAGGRGAFRIQSDVFDVIWQEAMTG